MIEKTFENRIKISEEQVKNYQKQYNRIANLRLLVLILSLGMTYLLVQNKEQLLIWGGTLVAYGAFIYLVKIHQKLKMQIDQLTSHILINQKYLKRLTDEWKHFEDTGEDMLDKDHPYAYDLDILGTSSLFQKINTSHTWHGRQELAQVLLKSNFKEKELMERQEAIRELIHDLDFCQQMEGAAIRNKKMQESPERLMAYAKKDTQFFKSSWAKTVVYVLPYITVGSLVLGYVFEQQVVSLLGVLLMFGSYLYQFIYLGKINEVKGLLTAMMYDLATYKEMLEILHQKQFKSPYLQHHIQVLCNETTDALEGMKVLESLGNKAALAHQPLLAIPLDALLLWDLKVVLQVEAWRKQYGSVLEEWLYSIGKLESLVSLSVLGHIEEVTFPIVKENDKYIGAKVLGHPLIAASTRVCNTFELSQEIFIITGSNMSGKTTFLRTLGINLVLAYTGAPVIAKQMVCSKLDLCTSMRIRDDLSEGISTFYAELTRIKMITEKVKANDRTLFLIDEIFRGTNSVDRIIGAKSVVKGMQRQGAVGAITTHDLEMCELAKEGAVSNYHFTEDYHEEGITFDYKLKEGPSTTTNAKYLMRMVGIDIVE